MFGKRKLLELFTRLLSPERLLSPYLPSTCSACFHRSDYTVLRFRSSATTSAFAGFSTLYNDFFTSWLTRVVNTTADNAKEQAIIPCMV